MATSIQYINGFYTGNNYLNQDQILINSVWISTWLKAARPDIWTSPEAMAAMLGNMQQESTVNPGLWQDRRQGNMQGGYGLVQWTPATKYLNWCVEQKIEPAYMDSALKRIMYEMDNELQWIPLRLYDNITFKGFAKNVENYSLDTLVRCFCRCYERAGVEAMENRTAYANIIYEFLEGFPVPPHPSVPIDPDVPTPPGQYWFQNKWFLYIRKKHRR